MSQKQKQNKQKPDAKQPEEVKKSLFETNPISFWSESLKKNVVGTLETSLLDTVENWGFLDYGVRKEVFDDNPQGVKSFMKAQGYYLLSNAASSGCYFFQHYTKKKKST